MGSCISGIVTGKPSYPVKPDAPTTRMSILCSAIIGATVNPERVDLGSTAYRSQGGSHDVVVFPEVRFGFILSTNARAIVRAPSAFFLKF